MNELKNLDAFNELVKNYHPSEKAFDTLAAIKLVPLVAPTSSGRNTLIRELLKTGRYYFIVSDTTRKPRVNDGVLEQNGEQYWFRSEEEMLQDIKDGKYLEAEVLFRGQQVSGISIRELEKAHQLNKVAITDVDIGGVNNILSVKPDAITILVLPPSFKEWQRRIKTRGEMSDQELRRRLRTAVTIFTEGLNSDKFTFLVSFSVKESAAKMDKIIFRNEIDKAEQEQARAIAGELLEETRKFLNFPTSTLD